MKSKFALLKTVLFSFLIGALLFILFLPFLCDTYLLPKLIEKLPFSQKEFSLSRISPWKIRGTLRLLQNNTLVVSIPKFEIIYNPLALLRGEFDTILLDGPAIRLPFQDAPLTLAGDSQDNSATQRPMSPLITMPITVDKIVIRDSHLMLINDSGTQDVLVDGLVEIETQAVDGSYQLTQVTTKVDTSGAINLKSSIKAELSEQEIHITTEMRAPSLTEFCQFTAIDQAKFPSGSLNLTAEVNVNPNTFTVRDFKVQNRLHNLRGSLNNVFLRQTEDDSPVELSINGTPESFRYTMDKVSVESSKAVVDIRATGAVQTKTQSFTCNAELYSKQLNNIFRLQSDGSYLDQILVANLVLHSDSFSIAPETSVDSMDVKGNVRYESNILQSWITGAIDNIQIRPKHIQAENINWDMHFQFPQQAEEPDQKSVISIGGIHYKDEKIATITADIFQKRDAINFSADLISQMDIQATAHCTGYTLYSGSRKVNCSLPATAINSHQLPSFISTPENTQFTGVISTDIAMEIKEGLPRGNLSLHLTDGTVTSGETEMSGIETTVHFPNLPSVQSAPGQLMTIGSIDSGKIHLEDGQLHYRIENEQQLLLEKAKLSWCGGKIETGFLALSPEITDLDITVYCDRLGFAELLQQFGIEDTEGEGSLNGKLPISISDQGIVFDDGFLFSTPGNSGIVRFTNTEQLQQGMPDIGQSATLDYSLQSLENFAYNWTKLSFNTEDSNLLLALQLDGEPAEPLPFGYKNGQIVATDKGPGLQHPVRLDMNFRLPLQELFQYGKSLQSLMENM